MFRIEKPTSCYFGGYGHDILFAVAPVWLVVPLVSRLSLPLLVYMQHFPIYEPNGPLCNWGRYSMHRESIENSMDNVFKCLTQIIMKSLK